MPFSADQFPEPVSAGKEGDKFPVARKSRAAGHTSRWRLVVSAYNAIRIRTMNSEAVLKGTKLALFNINETTLVCMSIKFLTLHYM